MQGVATESGTTGESALIGASRDFAVTAHTIVFRVVRDELCVGLPFAAPGTSLRRIAPSALPEASAGDDGLAAAARLAAARVVTAREIVRIGHGGVRVIEVAGAGAPLLSIVSWAIARPITIAAGAVQSVEADEHFVPLSALPTLEPATRAVLACAFDAFLDATLADALTRRLLPRHVLFRKTDGFNGRSPFESALGGEPSAPTEPDLPIFVGLLPDPFPLSSLRMLYERLLGAPLDRGNFRRQFHEIIAHGPIKALPIFERGVPHRAGQLFTFDRPAWTRFASR